MPPCMAEADFDPVLPKLAPARSPAWPPAACARGAEEGAAGCVSAASLLINKP